MVIRQFYLLHRISPLTIKQSRREICLRNIIYNKENGKETLSAKSEDKTNASPKQAITNSTVIKVIGSQTGDDPVKDKIVIGNVVEQSLDKKPLAKTLKEKFIGKIEAKEEPPG